MIVVDTSALLAIALDEPGADAVEACLVSEADLCLSAGTLAEALVVADRRGVRAAVTRVVTGLAIEVVPVDEVVASAVADAYGRWGKGVHPAGLNFGDCFAYALATQRDAPLLFVGDDFTRTDVRTALAPA